MKTAIDQLEEWTKEFYEVARYHHGEYKEGMNRVLDGIMNQVRSLKYIEKQQHEKTAIDITNIFMDALDNPKGGKFSGEDEFNKYWENNYTTNKETLK